VRGGIPAFERFPSFDSNPMADTDLTRHLGIGFVSQNPPQHTAA
jgi:hypothetical protein